MVALELEFACLSGEVRLVALELEFACLSG